MGALAPTPMHSSPPQGTQEEGRRGLSRFAAAATAVRLGLHLAHQTEPRTEAQQTEPTVSTEEKAPPKTPSQKRSEATAMKNGRVLQSYGCHQQKVHTRRPTRHAKKAPAW